MKELTIKTSRETMQDLDERHEELILNTKLAEEIYSENPNARVIQYDKAKDWIYNKDVVERYQIAKRKLATPYLTKARKEFCAQVLSNTQHIRSFIEKHVKTYEKFDRDLPAKILEAQFINVQNLIGRDVNQRCINSEFFDETKDHLHIAYDAPSFEQLIDGKVAKRTALRAKKATAFSPSQLVMPANVWLDYFSCGEFIAARNQGLKLLEMTAITGAKPKTLDRIRETLERLDSCFEPIHETYRCVRNADTIRIQPILLKRYTTFPLEIIQLFGPNCLCLPCGTDIEVLALRQQMASID